MIRSLLSCIGALVLPLPLSAHAAAPAQGCHLRMEMASANWVIEGYDAFGGDTPQASYDVTFINNGDMICRIIPRFTTDGSVLGLETGNGSRLSYTLLDASNGTNVTPVAGRSLQQSNTRNIEIAPGGQQLVRYELKVDLSTLPGDGRFTQRLFLVADQDNSEIASRPVIVGIHIRPSAVISLSGAFRRSNGQADVDLGELHTGVVVLPLQLHVLSTRAYDLQFQSRNGGKLRLDGSEWAIPYSLIVGDKPADILAGKALSPSVANAIKTDSMPIAFDIGSVESLRAGTYSDLITISVSVK